jgi:hypothetical protein
VAKLSTELEGRLLKLSGEQNGNYKASELLYGNITDNAIA